MQLPPIVPDQAAGLTGLLRRDAATLAGTNAIQVLPVELIKGDARLATLVVPPPVNAESSAFVPLKDLVAAADPQGNKGANLSNPQGFRSSGLFQGNTPLDELNLGEWLRRISESASHELTWPKGNPTSAEVKAAPSLPAPPFFGPSVPSSNTNIRSDTVSRNVLGQSNGGEAVVRGSPQEVVRDLFLTLHYTLRQSGIFAAQDLAEYALARGGSFKASFSAGERVVPPPFQGLLGLQMPGTADSEAGQTDQANSSGQPKISSQLRDASPAESKSPGPREGLPVDRTEWAARDLRVTQDHVSRSQVESWFRSIDANSAESKQAAQLLINGNLVWEGQLATGIPLIIQRYDVWRQNEGRSKKLIKGAAISVAVALERLGGVTIDGRSWGGISEIVVAGGDDAGSPSEWRGWNELVERLNTKFGVILRAKEKPMDALHGSP